MRAASVATVICAAVAACAHEEPRSVTPPTRLEPRAATSSPSGPPQYLIADPSPRSNSVTLPLGGAGSFGLVVDKTRVVVGRGEPRVAPDTTDQPITGGTKIPGRFGGGFLFWTDHAVYRADVFDGPLKPVGRLPDTVTSVSFAPKYLLVRTQNGERWALGLPSGERKRIEPIGVADIEALDDGRALAFNDQGTAYASTDAGDHWADVTAQIKSSPSRVAVVDNEVWIFESAGGALRLEADGHLAAFDKQPPESPPEIRPRDPKWRGADMPLRAAFHSGAAVDDSTAVVVEDGDLVRIDVHSGEVTSVVAGRLPPDARCEAVPSNGDVLFACVSRNAANGGGASAFVISQTLSGDSPVIEQSFATNGQFYASDDGGLAFGGPCGGAMANPPPTGAPVPATAPDNAVCVRQPGGAWQEQDTSSLQTDGGTADVRVMRWIPRGDGRVVAFVWDAAAPGIFDPHSGSIISLPEDAREIVTQGFSNGYYGGAARYNGKKHPYYRGADQPMIDASWSFTSYGALRGWQRHGGMVEITDDGKVNRSPYSFDVLASGPYALGRTKEGRLYQSSDHGATWIEVAGPPSGAGAVDMRSCTTAGCDLGAFYRVGWSVRPPRIDPPSSTARPAPEVRRTRGLELACRPVAPPQTKFLARTASSPDDLGLGASRLPVAGENSTHGYLRNALPRGIVNPLHDNGAGGGDDASNIRALLSGYQTSREGDVIEVMGPNKQASQLRRPITYVAAFDPSAKIGRAFIAMSEVITVARGVGMANDEILSDDMTESGNVIIVTPVDASGPSDLAFHNPRGLLAVIKGERTKVAMRATLNGNNDATVVSGVSLAGDEAAFLEVESGGVGHVFKVASGGTTDLFDVSPTVNDTAFYPANPDAIAVGPKGDLGVIRTASGSDPSSAYDPAIVIQPAIPPIALAPWSTLKFADAPECREPGWRATLQMIGPWVRLSTPELRIDDSPMIARVKWNDKRVCLEGLEARLPNVTLRIPNPNTGNDPVPVATWLVARNGTFARVGIADGIEWRQALDCTVVQPPAQVAGTSP